MRAYSKYTRYKLAHLWVEHPERNRYSISICRNLEADNDVLVTCEYGDLCKNCERIDKERIRTDEEIENEYRNPMSKKSSQTACQPHYHHFTVRELLHHSIKLLEQIMSTQIEQVARLQAVLVEQKKTASEIATVQASVDTLKEKIVELQAIIDAQGSNASPELVAAVDAVENQAKIIDDQIPDVVPPSV